MTEYNCQNILWSGKLIGTGRNIGPEGHHAGCIETSLLVRSFCRVFGFVNVAIEISWQWKPVGLVSSCGTAMPHILWVCTNPVSFDESATFFRHTDCTLSCSQECLLVATVEQNLNIWMFSHVFPQGTRFSQEKFPSEYHFTFSQPPPVPLGLSCP